MASLSGRFYSPAFLIAAFSFSFVTQLATAQLFINEIYFDPPGGGDSSSEFIEIRGPAGMSLDDHYLIFLENELSITSNPGVVENIFDFGAIGESGASLGTNGFLTIRQAFNPYTTISPGTADHVNSGSLFTFGSGATSTVGHSDEDDDGIIENSGFTAMLIQVDSASGGLAPSLGQDLDVDDDNELDILTGALNWSILDSIGVNSENSDIDGLLYAPVNFSAGTPEGGINVPAGAIAFDVGAEIEYLGRWGDSTGSTLADWHASNLTNEGTAGFNGPDDFRQSGDPHGVGTSNQFVETSQGLPYGSEITGTLGSTNRFVHDGDYTYDALTDSFDNTVDGADFMVWQQNFGFGVGLGATSGASATREHGDGNRDRTVDLADLAVWESNFGAIFSPAVSTAIPNVQTIPEPSTSALLAVAVLGFMRRRR